MARASLCTKFWHKWRLLGDGVTVQWVSSHVGVQGMNGHMQGYATGATQAFQEVLQDKEVMDI